MLQMHWFSIKRIVVWILLLSLSLVTFILVGRWFNGGSDSKYERIKSIRQQQKIMHQDQVKKANIAMVTPNDSNKNLDKPKETHIQKYEEIQLPTSSSLPKLSSKSKLAFETFKSTLDIKEAFKTFKESKNSSMSAFLSSTYAISIVPNIRQEYNQFERSIHRHLSLYYQQYLLAGGTEARHLGIPVCEFIGLSGDGRASSELEEIAGSQGLLSFLEVTSEPENDFTGGKPTKILVKDFLDNKLNRDEARGKIDPSQLLEMREQEQDRVQRWLSRELNAVTDNPSKNIIQPICYQKQPVPRMIYPYFAGGDLISFDGEVKPLSYQGTPLTPDNTFLPKLARQLVQAIWYLHQNSKIVHFDIKPENILQTSPNRQLFIPTDHPAMHANNFILIDFGLSRGLQEVGKVKCVKSGTKITMSPEQVMCLKAGRGTDWWNLAATLWRLRVEWEPSISEEERKRLLRLRCPHWGHFIFPEQPWFDHDFSDLLSLMFVPDQTKRDFSRDGASIMKILDHPYLRRGKDVLDTFNVSPPPPPPTDHNHDSTSRSVTSAN